MSLKHGWTWHSTSSLLCFQTVCLQIMSAFSASTLPVCSHTRPPVSPQEKKTKQTKKTPHSFSVVSPTHTITNYVCMSSCCQDFLLPLSAATTACSFHCWASAQSTCESLSSAVLPWVFPFPAPSSDRIPTMSHPTSLYPPPSLCLSVPCASVHGSSCVSTLSVLQHLSVSSIFTSCSSSLWFTSFPCVCSPCMPQETQATVPHFCSLFTCWMASWLFQVWGK